MNLSNLTENKFFGKGVTICFIDTGIFPHFDFVFPKNKIIKFIDLINNKNEPYDDNGHGTFVAGICSGNGIFSCSRKGVATDANIISIKALKSSGESNSNVILDAMQWVYENYKKYKISIVCMSFGADFLDKHDPLSKGAQALWNVQYEGLGVYSITSQLSNKYISILNNSTDSHAAIVQASQIHNAMLWKIEVTESGNYKLVSLHSGMVIALPSSSTTNGLDLVQVSYTNDDVYTDEWLFEKTYDASIISIPQTHDSDTFHDTMETYMHAINYNNVYSKKTCINDNILLNHIRKSRISVIIAHGEQTNLLTSQLLIALNIRLVTESSSILTTYS